MDEEKQLGLLETLWDKFENSNPLWPALTFFVLFVVLVFVCAAKLEREDHWKRKDW